MPSLFALDDALQTTLCLRIVKYESRCFEGNPVFDRIAAVLSLVPRYAHQRYFETVVTLSQLHPCRDYNQVLCMLAGVEVHADAVFGAQRY